MVNASLLFKQKAEQSGIEFGSENELSSFIDNLQGIIGYMYREWGISYAQIREWKIGTFFWHVGLMCEEIEKRKEAEAQYGRR